MQRRWALVASAAVLAVGAAEPAAAGVKLDAKAVKQIAKLQQFKRSLSGAERKLDSRVALRLSGRTVLPHARTGVSVSRGRIDVDVQAREVTDDLLDRLKQAGAVVDYASGRVDSVRASIPLTAVDEVAAWKDVERVDEAVGAQTAVVSEGVQAHAVGAARAAHSISGIGVKLCALSDGIRSLAASQAAGELPAVDVLPGQAGPTNLDEGTAMLEILHDVAPRAQLGYATAWTSDASFADNIRALRFQAGCDVIVDDILYFNEHPFQDGLIARAVNDVTADGALYFSAAGNDGNIIDGTAGNYEADFVDSGLQAGKFAGAAHDFDPGPGVQIFDPLSAASSGVPVTLFWADPLDGAANDYDLYLFDADSNVVAFSQNVQDGNDDPYELLATPRGGLRLAVVRYRGADRYFQLSALRRQVQGLLRRTRRAGDAGRHARPLGGGRRVQHRRGAGVRAVSVRPRGGRPEEPGRAVPGGVHRPAAAGAVHVRRTATRLLQRRRDADHAWELQLDGRRRAPEAGHHGGGRGEHLGVGVPAVLRHVGGGAARGRDRGPRAVRQPGRRHGRGARGVPGDGARSGAGRRRRPHRPRRHPRRPGARVHRSDAAAAGPGRHADGDRGRRRRRHLPRAGESGTLTLPVTNVGDGTATGVSATVSTSEPGVTITPRARSYGTIEAGGTATRDYQIALAADYPLGKRFRLSVRVTFAGILSPTTASPVVTTGERAPALTPYAYTGPPVAIPDNSAAGASVTIPVDGVGYAAELTFSIDGTTCTAAVGATTVGLDHTYVGDLVGTLTAPTGRVARLFNRNGASGNNLCQVRFDDAASQPFASATEAPFTGSWRPTDPLDPFLDAPVDGDWRFHVVDAAPVDIGSIRAVTLHVRDFVE